MTAIDAFADVDQHPSVRSLSLPRDFGRPFSARAAAHAARTVEADAAVYLSNFENDTQAVALLGARRALWGNSPEVLRRVRHPLLVMDVLRSRGCAAPESSMPSPSMSRPHAMGASSSSGPMSQTMDDGRARLVKPLSSGGGRGVRRWKCGSRVSRGHYVQELVDGTPGSVVFVAAGGRAVVLGVSRQLIGEAAFGASEYRYCGSILAAAGDAQFAEDQALMSSACKLADAVAAEFGVVGVNGIDFIAHDGVAFAVEVNPRWSSSMELVERAYGISVFAEHASACADGRLPPFDVHHERRHAAAVGKAIVFARSAIHVGDTRSWLADETVRDVPRPGDRIAAGRPVCTVFATAANADACHLALTRRGEHVYKDIREWERV